MARVAFTAFYPSKPFWAVSPVRFQVPRVERWFHDQMAEVVYSKETDAFVLRVCRDGRILIRVSRLEHDDPTPGHGSVDEIVRRWGEYLNYLNAFYLLLDSAAIQIEHLAYFNLHEITNRDAFRDTYDDGKSSGGDAPPIESIALVRYMARFVGSYRSELQIEHEPTVVMRRVISENAISHAALDFERVVASTGAEKDLALFAKSLAEYKVGNYELCIVLAWFIIEAAINTLWETHVDSLNRDLPGGRRRINGERKDFLTGRDFPASIVSNMLELFGEMEHDLFDRVDSVRQYRNRSVHRRKSFTPRADESQRAMEIALSMIQRIWNIHVVPSLGYSVTEI